MKCAIVLASRHTRWQAGIFSSKAGYNVLCLRRMGAFSVYREGMDRQALQAGVDILAEAKRPLVIFPEGVITRTNDRLLALMDGVSFIARSSAKKRAAQTPPGQVVVHPVGIRYHFHGNIDEAIHQTLDDIEKALSWRPRRDPDRTQRIYRVGEALLWLKEIEYIGEPQNRSDSSTSAKSDQSDPRSDRERMVGRKEQWNHRQSGETTSH